MSLEFNSDEFQNEQTMFVDVILPLPLPLLYTYRGAHMLVKEIKKIGWKRKNLTQYKRFSKCYG